MHRLIPINSSSDILPAYQNTPLAELIEFHNLGHSFKNYTQAELLVSMCMDNRKFLRIPENFAFILRSGGGNLRYSEFKVSFAVAIGEVQHIALIGHTQCRMIDLLSKKDQFIAGLTTHAGWDPETAEEHFMQYAPMFEIGNEIDFLISEAQRLRLRYPKITIAPLLYKVEDNLLYMIQE